ncbi:MAG: hypothetical protein OEZ39_09295 [Gammaproteobacteria bacterium]|nr:hypothetical protein [Gammaproteobacteria bacterium]MDH5652039.1 hypothetical protein [Gammaproteobacteria bacterium]
MAKIEPGKGRTTIQDLPQGIEIIIPARKNYFLIIFMSFWLVGWGVGEVSAIRELLGAGRDAVSLFLVVWLAGWTAGGVFAILAWLYNINGKEVVRIDGVALTHVRNFVLFRRSKEYEIAHIKELRASSNNSSIQVSNRGMEYWGMSGGAVEFDYGRSTHQFGAGLDEAEAKHIVETIKKRYKSL